MSCLSPVTIHVNKQNYEVPCRQCLSCRLDYQMYLTFCVENELYDLYKRGLGATFCTFTYSDANLPPNGSLRKSDLQNLFKTVRTTAKRDGFLPSFKYIACGEYGDKFGRPHYHAVILGWSDVICHNMFRKYWTYGLSDFGVLRPGGVRYVLKYCTKSVRGTKAEEMYDAQGLERPFISHSHKIGYDWLCRNADDIVANNFTYLNNGVRRPIPKYFRDKYDYFKTFNPMPAVEFLKREGALHSYPDYREWSKVKAYNKEKGLIQRTRQEGIPVDDGNFIATPLPSPSLAPSLVTEVLNRP
ncbi:replication initiation protein [Tortoise microvirus 41]|nr:replication initiation protein [Tortoise microvirus 41]